MEINELREKILMEIEEVFLKVKEGEIKIIVDAISNSNRIFIDGKGRSGNAMKNFGMRLMHLGLETYVVGETTTPSIREGDLLLIGSGSGNTPSLISHVEKAKLIGSKIGLMTINPDSKIARNSDYLLIIPAFSPKMRLKESKSIQPMANLFEQVLGLTGAVIVMELMKKIDKSSGEMFLNHANLE